jgi:hypothetical protein
MDNKRLMSQLKQLETHTDRFEETLSRAFDYGVVDNLDIEDVIMARVDQFENEADMLAERAEDNEVIASDIQELLSRGLVLEMLLAQVPKSKVAQQDWTRVKQNLDEIAKGYNVAWVWTLDANPYWKTASTERLFDRLELRSDEFMRSFNDALDSSKLNGTELENKATEVARGFEDSIDRLEDMADNRQALKATDVDMALKQAVALEGFMLTHNLSPRARRDWVQVKALLNELAFRSGAAWTWTVKPVVTGTSSR